MDYTPLRISTIRPYKKITFDLHINYKEKFLKYIENGKELDNERLAKLKKQEIAKFFIPASQETAYQLFLDECLSEMVNSDDCPVEEKTEIVEGAAQTAIERMQEEPDNRVAYALTEMAAGNLRELITRNPESLKIIFKKEVDDSDIIIKHSLNVSALATKLAQYEKLSINEQNEIATAGLIHDIGFTKMSAKGITLFKKKKTDLTTEELKIYNSHPQEAFTMLQEKPYVTKNILELVLNHEENVAGNGPNKKIKPTSLEKIISITDSYDKRITTMKMTPKEAIKEMQIDELGNYNLELINLLKKVLKTEGILDI